MFLLEYVCKTPHNVLSYTVDRSFVQNIFHGAMSLDQLYLMRPTPSCTDHRTPIPGLYLCGSGCHPGGGVMGAAGANAAHIVRQDWKLFKK